jgi:hypothetical protein
LNEPARIRPEWYEAFLREPERAATLIIVAAITLMFCSLLVCSVSIYSRNLGYYVVILVTRDGIWFGFGGN